MKSLKIAYVVRNLEGNGGIQFFAKSVSGGLSGGSATINLINWKSPLSLVQEVLVRALPIYLSSKLYPLWFRQNIEDVVTEHSYDMIHFWHIKSAMAVLNSIKKPYVITCHGTEVMRPFVPQYQQGIFLEALKKAVLINTPSRFTKDYLVKEYCISSQKIVVVNPGIDTGEFKLRGEAAHITKNIGTLTRLIPRKNVSNVIKALTLLKARGVDFNYYLAGTGSLMMRTRILLRLRLSRFKWQYLGSVSDKVKKTEFYPSLDLFVLPPLASPKDVEGFGIVFLEANASGVPVLASKTGGVPDAVKENISGLFADPTNPKDIADKIQLLLNSKKDYRASSKYWADNFSQTKMAKEFKAMYEKLTL